MNMCVFVLVQQITEQIIIIVMSKEQMYSVWKVIETHFKMMSWDIPPAVVMMLHVIRAVSPQINSFSELAMASVQGVSSMSPHSYGLVVIFVAGLAIGSLITWRLTKRL